MSGHVKRLQQAKVYTVNHTFSFGSSMWDASEFANVPLYMREQSLRFAEALVAQAAVVMGASFQLAEWSLACWF